jgi:hypothetical protein
VRWTAHDSRFRRELVAILVHTANFRPLAHETHCLATACELADVIGMCLAESLRDQEVKGLPQHRLLRIAECLFRTRIEANDALPRVDRNDRIGRNRTHTQGERRARRLSEHSPKLIARTCCALIKIKARRTGLEAWVGASKVRSHVSRKILQSNSTA